MTGVLIAALFCYGAVAPRPTAADECAVSLSLEDYTWKELNDNSSRLLKESGDLIGLGFSYQHELSNHVTFSPRAEIFGGQIDYAGQTQSGIPATSTVTYVGSSIETEAGRKYEINGSYYIEPFGGLGFRAWQRGINNGTTVNGASASGITEDWVTTQALIGMRGGVTPTPRLAMFAEAGMKLPLYNEEAVYFGNGYLRPDANLHPGKQTSFFGEVGTRFRCMKAGVFYDGMRFSRSDQERITGGYVYQPRSVLDIYGVKIGVAF